MVDEIVNYCNGCGEYVGYIDKRDQAKGEVFIEPCRNCCRSAQEEGFAQGQRQQQRIRKGGY